MISVDSENIPPNNSIPSTPNAVKKGDIDAIRERLSLLRKPENSVPPTPKEKEQQQPIQKEIGWDSFPLQANPARPRLVDKVKKNIDHPTPWWELLICDLDTYKLNQSDEFAKSILRVFEASTRSINKEQHFKHQDYFNIWIGYARFLELRSENEAREMYKFILTEGIGSADANLYTSFAEFEFKCKNNMKAMQVLQKGIQKSAITKEQAEETTRRCKSKNGEFEQPMRRTSSLTLPPPSRVAVANQPSEDSQTIQQSPDTQSPSSSFPTVSEPPKIQESFKQPVPAPQQTSPQIDRPIEQKQDISKSHLLVPNTSYGMKQDSLVTPMIEKKKEEIQTPSIPPSKITPPSPAPLSLASTTYAATKLHAAPQTPYITSSISQVQTSASQPSYQSSSYASQSLMLPQFPQLDNPSFQTPQAKNPFSSITPSNAQPTSNIQYQQPSVQVTVAPQLQKPIHNSPPNVPVQPEKQITPPPAQPVVAPSPAVMRAETVNNSFTIAKEWSNELITVNMKQYVKLAVIGKGGSSKVYKVLARDMNIYAIKRVNMNGDASIVESYINEIDLLKRLLTKRNIIKLIDSEINYQQSVIYLVLEFGEIDLAHALQQQGDRLNENYLRLLWQQMLEAVHTIHEEKIIHSDLKPANFVFAMGVLKLIDFGIAKAIQSDTTNIVRESGLGTLNYISPEALTDVGTDGHQKMKLGRASDIWSLGCILYQLVYGKLPFGTMPVMKKIKAITDHRWLIPFPDIGDQLLMDVLKRCLQRDPKLRPTIPELLAHPFLHPSKNFAVAMSQM